MSFHQSTQQSNYVAQASYKDREAQAMAEEEQPMYPVDECLRHRALWIRVTVYILRLAFGLAGIYLFLLSLSVFGKGVQALTKQLSTTLFQAATAPGVALAVGVMGTSLVQSSSTTTSLVVALVGVEAIDLDVAVPMIMGANIGTAITNTIVSWFFAYDEQDKYVRAFSAATVHDAFNILNIALLFSIDSIVAAFNNGQGFLIALANATVSPDNLGEERDTQKPFDVLFSAAIDAIIVIDKKKLQDITTFLTVDEEAFIRYADKCEVFNNNNNSHLVEEPAKPFEMESDTNLGNLSDHCYLAGCTYVDDGETLPCNVEEAYDDVVDFVTSIEVVKSSFVSSKHSDSIVGIFYYFASPCDVNHQLGYNDYLLDLILWRGWTENY